MYLRLTKVLTAALLLAAAPHIARAQGPPGGPPGPGGMRGPGGFGGFGGMRGPGGFGGTNMLLLEPVAKEIKLTEKQKTSLKKVEASAQAKRRQFFESRQEEGFDPEAMRTSMEKVRRDQEAAVAKILNKDQKDRVEQIGLQQEGILAVAKADVAKKLKLTSAQTGKIETVMAEMRDAQMKLMPRPPGGGPGGPGGPGFGGFGQRGQRRGGGGDNANGGGQAPGAEGGGFPGGAPPDGEGQPGEFPPPGGEGGFAGGPPPGGEGGFAGGRPPGGGAGGPGGRPDFNPEEFRARFEKIRQEQEKIRSKTVKEIESVLTKDQKASFDKMLGKPFDLASLRQGFGRGNGQNRTAPGSPQAKRRARSAA